MNLIGEKKLSKLRKLFKDDPKILLAYLFGSQARQQVNPLSDVDLAVLVKKPFSLDDEAILISEIASILETERLDLVILNYASTLLKFKIIAEGRALYCEGEGVRTSFEENIIGEYLFLKPIIEEYDKCFFERIKEEAKVGRRQRKTG
jgi:predicted nucleotidyltransferase